MGPYIINVDGLQLTKEEKESFDKSITAVKDLFSVAKKIDPSL